MNDVEELPEFCRSLLASLPRSDQRRWGEIYVRGLVSVPGRKSIRRISEHVVGHRADQGLQQFVNQSPWRAELVRLDLAQRLTSLFRPRAWVVEELAFRKNGQNSCGVARQYVPSAGRVMNCQLGLGVFLAGDGFAGPVNWRLVLPPRWDADPDLRERAHLPVHEPVRSRWGYLLDALDEMVEEWALSPAPVLVDASHDASVDPALLHGLEERGLRYLVRIAPGATVDRDPATGRLVTAAQVAQRQLGQGAAGLFRSSASDGQSGSVCRYAVEQLIGGHPDGRVGWLRHRPRRLLIEWSGRSQAVRGMWLTNCTALRLPELVELTRTRERIASDVDALHENLGLGHFEGRSFRGWHHHVTLVSVAHAYTLVDRIRWTGRHGRELGNAMA